MPKLACFSLFCSPCDFTIYSPYMWLICTKGAKLSSHPLIFNTNLCGRYMTKTGALYRKSQNWLVSLGPLYGFLHTICMILPKLFIVWTKIGCFTHSCGLLLITSLKKCIFTLAGSWKCESMMKQTKSIVNFLFNARLRQVGDLCSAS